MLLVAGGTACVCWRLWRSPARLAACSTMSARWIRWYLPVYRCCSRPRDSSPAGSLRDARRESIRSWHCACLRNQRRSTQRPLSPQRMSFPKRLCDLRALCVVRRAKSCYYYALLNAMRAPCVSSSCSSRIMLYERDRVSDETISGFRAASVVRPTSARAAPNGSPARRFGRSSASPSGSRRRPRDRCRRTSGDCDRRAETTSSAPAP